MFEPIAIVGRSCLLPGAASPDELWDLVATRRSAITARPAGRWRAPPETVLTSAEAIQAGGEGCVTDRGGFVRGFEKLWRPEDYAVDRALLDSLDPLFHWLLHTARAALVDAGIHATPDQKLRVGAIVGNLAYPSDRLVDLASAHFTTQKNPTNPLNRFSTGYPVHLTCEALGLACGGHALDAACASSLYAIKLACDWLRSRRADAMLAGAVNRCDALTIYSGFSALRALSPSGRSRPFHRDADGLLPAEGAAFVVLKRLDDAERVGDRILGVIRGVGLSNDGRGGSLLAPSEAGQVRAMRQAFLQSGLASSDISLIECHATGTALGDAAELRSMSEVYRSPVAIGSLKSNLGHLVTASGLAGLIKILESLRHELKPATLYADPATDALGATPFRLLNAAEPWRKDGVRRAAVSSFGFGGNNAHLLLEEYAGLSPAQPRASGDRSPVPAVAVIGIGARVADGHSVDDFARCMLNGESRVVLGPDGIEGGFAHEVRLPTRKLAAPPRDMARALGQQTMLIAAVDEAVGGLTIATLERTSVFVGMQCDAEGARSSLRLSLQSSSIRKGDIEQPLDAARVVGCMGNVPANRINRQHGFEGPSFSFFAEELSGICALDAGIQALASGDANVVVVGATDLCVEPVHAAAAETILSADYRVPGDAACALVLKRLTDAERDGDAVFAHIAQPVFGESGVESSVMGARIRASFGHAHAASGLLEVLGAVVALDRRAMPSDGTGAIPLLPRPTPHAIDLSIPALGNRHAAVKVMGARKTSTLRPTPPLVSTPDIRYFAGASPSALRESLKRGVSTDPAAVAAQDMRLVIGGFPDEMDERMAQADRFLADREAASSPRKSALPEGIFFRDRPVGGEVGFVFTGAAAAYSGMGRDLVLAFPRLVERISDRCEDIERRAGWIYAAEQSAQPDDFAQLCGASFLCQLHAEFTRHLLDIKPDATIGLSSGETNALLALGLWHDMGGLLDDVETSGLYTEVLGGRADAIHAAWQERGVSGGAWANYRVVAPAEMVAQAISDEPTVHITIINGHEDYVIGGDADACDRVIAKIGRTRAAALPMRLAVHCPDVKPAAALWRRLHHRPVTPIADLRIYGNAHGGAYTPTMDSVADALTAQALDRVDFPRTIRQAWEDGVRIFIEHGPRGQCTQSIRSILGDRPHLAVALDIPGRNSLLQATYAVGELLAAGLGLNLKALRTSLGLEKTSQPAQPSLLLPAHPPPISLGWDTTEVMPRAEPPRAHTMVPAPQLSPPIAFDWQVGPSVERPRMSPAAAVWSTDGAGTLRGQALELIAASHHRMTTEHTAYLAHAAEQSKQFYNLQMLHPSVPKPALRRPIPRQRATGITPAIEPVRPVSPLAPSHTERRGPTFTRADLEHLASGRISKLFGPQFAVQDGFDRQVRMPMPPLLLADRVTGLTGEAGSMGRGSIWTETDVQAGAWYLHHGRMPAGIMIESGQADLLLVSWLGANLHNRGERIYRLLGCDLTFHDELPKAGDTLRYDIHIDNHARLGEIGMFFFHYDARVDEAVRLSVRNGQAGFFTDEELANSEGVLWSAESSSPTSAALTPLEPCPRISERRAFHPALVQDFHEGRVLECFGTGFERARLHTRTPRSPGGQMQLLHSVPVFEPTGGPWGRGYVRAEWPVSTQDWFFNGHFKNDPCMPGTLMFEACLQAMAFALTALGFTLERDGWRFEPVPEQTYQLRCRGQVTPASGNIVYEVFIDEIVAGPLPTIFADVLATVDGLKAFHCARLGLRLVPDWPLEACARPLERQDANAAASAGGITFDSYSLLACATGRPSTAFGPMYKRFDGPIRVPRLPSPPYHFMTRVTHIRGEIGAMKVGSLADVEYDIPADAWYFADNHRPVMPFCVLIEAMLQTCGWLASFVGCALETKEDLFFRHLDGSGVVHAEVPASARILGTRVTLKSLSRMGTTSITGFTLETTADGVPVATFDTLFGYFPGPALANQVGIASVEDERQWLTAESSTLPSAPEVLLGRGKLRLIDRISGFWPTGGADSRGRVRAEKAIAGDEWFFKAHFFNDPVQPGSLGLEAVLQTIQAYMLATRRGAADPEMLFEPIASGEAASWKCRGQILPHNKLVIILVEISDDRQDDRGRIVIASGSLWVDGMKIYAVSRIGLRMLSAPPPLQAAIGGDVVTHSDVFDRTVESWAGDHRPTYTLPALPLMSIVDRLAVAVSAASAARVVEIRDFSLNGWFLVDQPRRFETTVKRLDAKTYDVRFVSHPVAAEPKPARAVAAHARIRTAASYPDAPGRWPVSHDMPIVHELQNKSGPNLYQSGILFHGPAFQVMQQLRRSSQGALAVLDAGASDVPFGALNQRLLDGIVQAIPNDRLHFWFPSLPSDRIGYPSRIEVLTLFDAVPREGLVECHVRPDGFADQAQTAPRFAAQLIAGGRVFAETQIVYALFPQGPIGALPPVDRRAFLREQKYISGVMIGRHSENVTTVTSADFAGSDWLPGTLATAFGLKGADPLLDLAIKQHAGIIAGVHPATIEVSSDGRVAGSRHLPLNSISIRAEGGVAARVVRSDGLHLDVDVVRAFWEKLVGVPDWLVTDLYLALLTRFVRRVEFTEPEARNIIAGRPVLFLCNHQVGVESALFSVAIAAATRRRVVTIAKTEHRTSWIGRLLEFGASYPQVRQPRSILHFNRQDANTFFHVLKQYREELKADAPSLMVHAEGTRSLSCRAPVTRVSSVLLDLAAELQLPIIPVRFVGGLPVAPLAKRIEFPIGLGRQDFVLGAAIMPEVVAGLPLIERSRLIRAAINGLPPEIAAEQPFDGDAAPGEHGVITTEEQAKRVLIDTLRRASRPSDATTRLLAAVDGTALGVGGEVDGWLHDFADWLREGINSSAP